MRKEHKIETEPVLRCPLCGEELCDGMCYYTLPDGTPIGCEACVERHII